jgi:hypothetical protein
VTEADLVNALDEGRALTLALIEVLNETMVPAGSFATIISKQSIEKVLKRQADMIQRFRREREERSRGLVLPPGAKRADL